MKAFTYERADTAAHAAALATRPGAKIIAGGTNLLDLMKLQVETPTRWSATATSPRMPACASATGC